MRIRDHRKRVARRGWLNTYWMVDVIAEWNGERWVYASCYWNGDHSVQSKDRWSKIKRRRSKWTV